MPNLYISKIQLPDGNLYNLKDSNPSVQVDGITGNTINHFLSCSTNAATSEKIADFSSDDSNFSLVAGAKVTIQFDNTNTADTPTLNINSTGAKEIYHCGSQITTEENKKLLSGVVEFVYDGTYWNLIGNYIDENVKTESKSTGTYYLAGSSSSTTTKDIIQKNSNVYITSYSGTYNNINYTAQRLTLGGSSTSSGGSIRIYTQGYSGYGVIEGPQGSSSYTLRMPTKGGTIAVTSDLKSGTVTSITPGDGLINGTSGTSKAAITSSGTISIQSGGVTNEMLANSKITIANNEISLGDSVTLSELGICANNDARLSDARTPLSHTHGNITNEGNIAANSSVTIGNGDCLIITDNSNSNKIVTSSIAFDGATTTKALTQAGTWETFNNYELPVASSSVLGGIKTGYTTNNNNYAVLLNNENSCAYVNVPWTDTKVTQSPSTDSNWKKVLLSTDVTASPSTEMGIKTNTTDFCNKITSQPSTGTLRAEIFRIRQYMELQWNETDGSLDFVFI